MPPLRQHPLRHRPQHLLPQPPRPPLPVASSRPGPRSLWPQHAGTKVESPMPGSIIDIKVQTGAAVKEGDVIIILEAMKMEN